MQEQAQGHEAVGVGVSSGVLERITEHAHWCIEKYADDGAYIAREPFEVVKFDGNLLLTEGINELWLLFIGGAGTAYSNANAYLGVGDDNTAAAAAQTGLQAAVNKEWKGMEATYPTTPPVSGQVVFRSVFGAAEGNFDWEEFTVVNAATDAGENLCRKVSSQGTKALGQTWTLTLTVTLT